MIKDFSVSSANTGLSRSSACCGLWFLSVSLCPHHSNTVFLCCMDGGASPDECSNAVVASIN